MAVLSGTAGSVVYMTGGTTVVGEIKEWSANFRLNVVDATAFGDNWEKYIPSIKGMTGSFSGNWDNNDTAQAAIRSAMLGGSAIALRLYLDDSQYYNVGTAYVTGENIAISNDGKADTSFDFQSSGEVTLV